MVLSSGCLLYLFHNHTKCQQQECLADAIKIACIFTSWKTSVLFQLLELLYIEMMSIWKAKAYGNQVPYLST